MHTLHWLIAFYSFTNNVKDKAEVSDLRHLRIFERLTIPSKRKTKKNSGVYKEKNVRAAIQ